MRQLNLWSERDKDVKREDWYIIIVGTDNEEYDYDGTTEATNNSDFIKEIEEYLK